MLQAIMYIMNIPFINLALKKCCLSILLLAFVFCLPVLYAQVNASASKTGKYKSVFKEAGYKQIDIDTKINRAYKDLFESPKGIYFKVGDSMGYVSDLKNHDARSEGLSYGMMVAVQLNKKEVFDRIWRWTKKYLQHQDGPREGYIAWSINPATMKKNSEGSASDGE